MKQQRIVLPTGRNSRVSSTRSGVCSASGQFADFIQKQRARPHLLEKPAR